MKKLEFKPYPPRKQHEAAIPMISIAFLLLIFFMLSGSIVSEKVAFIEPPLSSSEEKLSEANLVILLDKAGNSTIAQQSVVESDIINQALDGKTITIQADAEATSYHLLNLVSELKNKGASKIELMTIKQ